MMTPTKIMLNWLHRQPSYKPGRGSSSNIRCKEVCEKFQVISPQVIDILGLWGDASDNIPGIPGIGEKRQKLLISKHGSMEGIFETEDPAKAKRKCHQLSEQGLMSKSWPP